MRRVVILVYERDDGYYAEIADANDAEILYGTATLPTAVTARTRATAYAQQRSWEIARVIE